MRTFGFSNLPLQVILISLCLNILVNSSTNTDFSKSYATWSLVLLIMFWLSYHYGKKKSEYLELFETSFSLVYIFACLMALGMLGLSFSTDQDLQSLVLITHLLAPSVVFILLAKLTHNSAIQTNQWSVLAKEITKFSRQRDEQGNPFVVAFLPSSDGKNITYHRASSVNLEDLQIRGPHSTIMKQSIQNSVFIFRVNMAQGQHLQQYGLPSVRSYQRLNDKENIRVPATVRILESNAEAHFLIMQMFHPNMERENAGSFDFHQMMMNNRNIDWPLKNSSLAGSSPEFPHDAILRHKWSAHKLAKAGSRIYRALISQRRSNSEKNLAAAFFSGLHSQNRQNAEHILTLVSLLHYGYAEDHPPDENWMGAIQGYSSSYNYIYHFTEENQMTKNQRKTQNEGEIIKTVTDLIPLLQSYFSNPIESFIENHDLIVHFSQNNDNQEANDEFILKKNNTLDQMIHSVINHLNVTKYKRTLAGQDKYDTQELVGIRQGMVTGVTIGLVSFIKHLRRREH
jgi:hypothetical protein